jgi:hypothetical protein
MLFTMLLILRVASNNLEADYISGKYILDPKLFNTKLTTLAITNIWGLIVF